MSKKSQMTQKRVKKTTKSVFGDFFDTFLTLRAGRPGKSFLRLFGDFGARGCGDSCIWGLHTQQVSNSKAFQDGNGNGNFWKINSNDFQDGKWEPIEKKG